MNPYRLLEFVDLDGTTYPLLEVEPQRLIPGDRIVAHPEAPRPSIWDIVDDKIVQLPMADNRVGYVIRAYQSVRRLEFRCEFGQWRGYIFPATGTVWFDGVDEPHEPLPELVGLIVAQ